MEWQRPVPQGNDLFRMSGFSDGTFYAVGEAGTVVHYDGQFEQVDTPIREDLHGVWAESPTNVYACGFDGTLIHFDGTAWTKITVPTHEDLYAVWTNGSNDIFVAGTNGLVLNFNSDMWTEYAIAPQSRFRALWGYSHSEVYVCGSNGALFRFDGTSWTRMILFDEPNFDAELYDLWGPAPGSISMVDRFNILWFNGTWHGISLRPSNGLGLWGFALNQQIAVSNGVSEHLAGTQLKIFNTQTQEPLFDVWGPSTGDCFAVGRSGSIEHFDGVAWQALNNELLDNVYDVAVAPAGAIAVGDNGLILRQNGSSWIRDNLSSNYELSGVCQAGGLTVAVGRYAPNKIDWRQAILTSTGGNWTDAGAVGAAPRLFDVWASSASNVYAVGWGGEILRYDGSQWRIAEPGSGTAYLLSVSGSPYNAIAVGRTNGARGLICYFNGISWLTTIDPSVEELRGVWVENMNSAFAVGSKGAIRHYSNGAWSTMSSPTTAELFCVNGTNGNDVYAGGWNGTLLHYDGTSWRELLPSTNRNIYAISSQSATDLYLAGERGSIWHLDGLLDSVALR